MKTAILIDGAFFIKRIRKIEKPSELYRIFFYDCIPFEKKMHNPISLRSIDFAKTDEAIFRHELHQELKSKRKLALHLGKLSDHAHGQLNPPK